MDRVAKKHLIEGFTTVPHLSESTIDDFSIKQMAGYSNFNFHIKNSNHDWILRVPKEETNLYIDRSIENHNVAIAIDLGLAPNCLWRNEKGLSLCDTVQQARSLVAKDLFNPDILTSLIAVIQKLHQSDKQFSGNVDLKELLSRYYHVMPKQAQRKISGRYREALQKLDNVLLEDQLLVPSHNDLVLENILFDGNKIWIIDWEYASMASPYWDIATICNAGQLSSAQAQAIINLYQEAKLNIKLLADYRLILDVLSTCWMLALTNVTLTSDGQLIDGL